MTQIRYKKQHHAEEAPVTENPNGWKKTIATTFLDLQLIPEKFNGELVLTFKEGGVSYLRKTETFK